MWIAAQMEVRGSRNGFLDCSRAQKQLLHMTKCIDPEPGKKLKCENGFKLFWIAAAHLQLVLTFLEISFPDVQTY